MISSDSDAFLSSRKVNFCRCLQVCGLFFFSSADGFVLPSTRSINNSLFLKTQNSVDIPDISILNLEQTSNISKTQDFYSKVVGSANLDWANLGFSWRDVNAHIKFVYKDGEWGPAETVKDPYVSVHIANTAMHYGQSAFEGLKAFQSKDGKVRIFRPYENAARIKKSAERVLMAVPPPEMFVEGAKAVVRENIEFVPPYGSGGSLYIRPLLFGSGPRIGLQPSDEYTLLMMVVPVGNYYKGGMIPTSAVVISEYDRAAPRGVGAVKVAGNYAADMLPNIKAKKEGYSIGLYLDAKTNTYVEEFSTSNFFAITKDERYVTPDSSAVLPSITNLSLMDLALDEGMKVEKRRIPISEVGEFAEIAACGTAVVITPIKEIVFHGQSIPINGGSDEVGPVLKRFYERVRSIQSGDLEDKFNWMEPV